MHPPWHERVLRKGTPDFRAGRHLCRECTTAWMQEVGQRREQLPRDAQERPAPRMRTSHAGRPCSALVSDGPRKGPSSLPLSLRRSKARGSPSVASPFDGMTVHWTVIFARLTPVPGADARCPYRAPAGVFFAFVPPSA